MTKMSDLPVEILYNIIEILFDEFKIPDTSIDIPRTSTAREYDLKTPAISALDTALDNAMSFYKVRDVNKTLRVLTTKVFLRNDVKNWREAGDVIVRRRILLEQRYQARMYKVAGKEAASGQGRSFANAFEECQEYLRHYRRVEGLANKTCGTKNREPGPVMPPFTIRVSRICKEGSLPTVLLVPKLETEELDAN